ncbi:MAG: DNA replication/repair protein RecF [bacterium]|nr:DNA replication/repair protein RecF [bacterium]
MRLKHLELEHFKNYNTLSFDFGEEPLTILTGNNGQGKTNFLEAIVLLALSKSFSGLPIRDMVSWPSSLTASGPGGDGGEYFRITGLVETKDGEQELQVFCGRAAQYPKTLKINGVKTKPSDYVGHLKIVLFTPRDINLLELSPQFRRRYLNLMICQIDRQYLKHLSHYQVYLKHRNKLLGQIGEGKAKQAELDHWDEKLAEHGQYLLEKRREVFDQLNQQLGQCYEKISGEQVELSLRWAKEWSESLLEYLRHKRQRDLEAGTTCGGPHREDFSFQMNGRNLTEFGSRGEFRSSILALKLSELELIRQVSGESPVILFDDVLSELDSDRQKNLLALFKSDQVIITATHTEKGMPGARYRVESGRVW